MKLAFIGLGNVGYPLARNLLKAGHSLVVHDLNRARAEGLLAEGAAWAESVAEAAAGAEAAVTSLPNPRAVAAVVPGEGGLIASLPEGALWIEMSTTDDEEMMAHAAAARAKNIAVVEAPITGGANRAWTGEISILVGAEEADYERALPLLQIMGGEIERMGPVGAASVVKVITNMLAFIHLLASGEALMLAKRAGIDLARAYHGIRISSGNSFAHETEGQLILNGSYNCGFTMDLALKDIGLTLDIAERTKTPLPLSEMTARLFEEARGRYGDKAWSTEAVRLLEDQLGVALRAPGFPEVLPGMEPALPAKKA
jgi:3-hydroxyisobutyrate dehydrogenase